MFSCLLRLLIALGGLLHELLRLLRLLLVHAHLLKLLLHFLLLLGIALGHLLHLLGELLHLLGGFLLVGFVHLVEIFDGLGQLIDGVLEIAFDDGAMCICDGSLPFDRLLLRFKQLHLILRLGEFGAGFNLLLDGFVDILKRLDGRAVHLLRIAGFGIEHGLEISLGELDRLQIGAGLGHGLDGGQRVFHCVACRFEFLLLCNLLLLFFLAAKKVHRIDQPVREHRRNRQRDRCISRLGKRHREMFAQIDGDLSGGILGVEDGGAGEVIGTGADIKRRADFFFQSQFLVDGDGSETAVRPFGDRVGHRRNDAGRGSAIEPEHRPRRMHQQNAVDENSQPRRCREHHAAPRQRHDEQTESQLVLHGRNVVIEAGHRVASLSRKL